MTETGPQGQGVRRGRRLSRPIQLRAGEGLPQTRSDPRFTGMTPFHTTR